MAFMQEKALQGDKSREEKLKKVRDQEQPESPESVSAVRGSEAQTPVSQGQGSPSQASQARPSVQQAFAPRTSAPSTQRPAQSGSPPDSSVARPAPSQSAPSQNTSVSTLSLRDEALVKAIAKFKNWTDEQVIEVRRRFNANPEHYLTRLQAIYDHDVVPTLRTTPSIKEWVSQNPNMVAFQFENVKGEIKSQVIAQSDPRAETYKIYHGLVMKSVSADDTPFAPPSELYQVEVNLAQSEEAFESSADKVNSTHVNSAENNAPASKSVSSTDAAGNSQESMAQFSTVVRQTPRM